MGYATLIPDHHQLYNHARQFRGSVTLYIAAASDRFRLSQPHAAELQRNSLQWRACNQLSMIRQYGAENLAFNGTTWHLALKSAAKGGICLSTCRL